MMQIISLIFVLAVRESPPPECQGPFTRAKVIDCSQTNSPRIHIERERIQEAQGQYAAARVLLPANPEISVSLSQRTNTVGDEALNVSGSVEQEIEIAGQRRKRMRVADAQRSLSKAQAEQVRREVIAEALLAYYEVLAAESEMEMNRRILDLMRHLEQLAWTRAKAGVGSAMGGELARAERTRIEEEVVLAQGRVDMARVHLAAALGLYPADKPPQVQGELEPMSIPKSVRTKLREEAMRIHPQLAVVRSAQRSEQAQLKVLQRSRIPNPRLTFFMQKDGFNERVIGGGVSFPIPLPAPLGRTYQGEIMASQARIRAAEERLRATVLAVQRDLAMAVQEYESRRKAADIYSPEIISQTERSIEELAVEIERGTISLGDALRMQQTLQDLLLRSIKAKHALASASVHLLYEAGISFAGETL